MSRTKLAVSTGVFGLAAIFASVALAAPTATVVSVTGTEYSFKASKKVLPVNKPITFKFKNVGDEPHDLAFSNPKKKTAFLAPGKSGTVKITFKK